MAEGEDCSEGRQRGRPSIEMGSDEVELLLSKGVSKSKLAEMLGVHMTMDGIKVHKYFAALSDLCIHHMIYAYIA